MDVVSVVFDVAMVVNVVAVILLARTAIKDRNVLQGFSCSGSVLTFIAMFFLEVGYLFMGNLVGFGLGLFGVAFWFLVSVFTFRKWVQNRRVINDGKLP